MKRILLLSIFLILQNTLLFGNNNFSELHFCDDSTSITNEDTTIYIIAEKMPEPIGGISQIQAKVIYTEEARLNNIEGKIFILAVVNEKGMISKAEVFKGLGYGLDESARNAVLSTRFVPGNNNGMNVKVQIMIPILFKLR